MTTKNARNTIKIIIQLNLKKTIKNCETEINTKINKYKLFVIFLFVYIYNKNDNNNREIIEKKA